MSRHPKSTLLALACALGLTLSTAPDSEAAQRRARIAKVRPTYAYLVPDSSQITESETDLLKSALAKSKRRRGVKKAELVDNKEIRLEIDPRTFKPENAILDLDGLRVEMRLPYKWIELRVAEGAHFPPRGEINDEDVLVIEVSPALREAIDQAVNFSMPLRMKCLGKIDSPKANEATLMRFQNEKLAPHLMIPFMATADFDGDKRPDLFLRFKNLPEMIVFNGKDGLKVHPLTRPPSELTSIPRCDQNPLQYARAVPQKQVQCLSSDKKPKGMKGDAFELVRHNMSNKLLMWDGGKITSCEPLGEGALPSADTEEE